MPVNSIAASCCKKKPPSSHLNLISPVMVSSSEPTRRPFSVHVPTRRSRRFSAGSGVGVCAPCAVVSDTMFLQFSRFLSPTVERLAGAEVIELRRVERASAGGGAGAAHELEPAVRQVERDDRPTQERRADARGRERSTM